jgi:hypothetical protein
VQICIETDKALTDKQAADFKTLFKWLITRSVSEMGSITIPFDGKGSFGKVEFKGYHELRAEQGMNGNGVRS